MAVKERKQITGTTAQIQAYKGHEGQIVWDKEKKTLVGMSGTAGKNYPLAPQAYVDNEVSKVNTSVTQGLAGKEDKGTCLPLTGGNITGGVTFNGSQAIRFNATESHKALEVTGGLNWKDGAGLFLRNNSATGQDESGSWGLVCQDKDTKEEHILLGRRFGLFYDGRKVDSVTSRSGHDIGNGGVDIWRFDSGIMFINGSLVIPGGQLRRDITFPIPFLTAGYGVGLTAHTENCDVLVSYDRPTPNGIGFLRKHAYNQGVNFDLAVKFNLIGFWK